MARGDEACKECGQDIFYCADRRCEAWHHYFLNVKTHGHVAEPEYEDLPLEQIDG